MHGVKHGRSKPSKGAGSAGQVRIIAGQWRGRKLMVPDVEGLRPTGDRVRETLFNWLQGDVAGAHCLDLFAGSGALGFEALSRYAQSVSFVEPDPLAFRNLRELCRILDVQSVAHLYAATAQATIDDWTNAAAAHKTPFDLVFIDPPFQMACQWTILQALVPRLLAENALIYVESPVEQSVPEPLPEHFEQVREKRFGDVMARLVRFSPTG